MTGAASRARRTTPEPATGIVDLFGMRTQLPLVSGFVLLILVALASIWFAVASHHFTESVTQTLQIRSTAYRLLTLVQDAETGERGYLLTGNDLYLRPYDLGRVEAIKAMASLDDLLADSDTQLAAMTQLHEAVAAKLKDLEMTTSLRHAGKTDAALAHVNTNIGNTIMQRVRELIARIEAEEVRKEDVLTAAADRNNNLLAAATLTGIALVIVLAAYTLLQTRRATDALVTAQRGLRHMNETLEATVAERVAELQLANEEVQRFAYIVSHDLRAPLVNVMGFTSELDAVRHEISDFLENVERVAPQLATEERRLAIRTDLPEALGFIRTSTAKMDRLINAILKMSREGRRVLTPQPIDLRELIEAQGRSLTHQLAEGDAELAVQDDLPDLVSDRLAVEQIFGNLIENATKYLFPGRPGRIEVSGRPHGAYLRYDVKDNGRGIEAKDYERIFELFRRSGEQDKPGEGIGLAYVRNLTRRLGGNVTVQSDYGKGSVFTVTLPKIFEAKTRSAR